MSVVLTHYRIKPDCRDEHQRLINAIFTELEATNADGFTFKVFRFSDGLIHSHVVITHDDVECPNDLKKLPSYRDFAAAWPRLCDEPPVVHDATVIGGWR